MAPGKRVGCWERDLDLDLQVLEEVHCTVLVTLLQKSELPHIGLPINFLEQVKSRGIEVIHFPVHDKVVILVL